MIQIKVLSVGTEMLALYGGQASVGLKGNAKLKIVYPEEGMQFGEDNFIISAKVFMSNKDYDLIWSEFKR